MLLMQLEHPVMAPTAVYSPAPMTDYRPGLEADIAKDVPPQQLTHDLDIFRLRTDDAVVSRPISYSLAHYRRGASNDKYGGPAAHLSSHSVASVRQRSTRSVALACTNCREVKKSCDSGEPCNRCRDTGKADTCVRATRKARVRRTASRFTKDAILPIHPAPPHVAAYQEAKPAPSMSPKRTDYPTLSSLHFASHGDTSSSTTNYLMGHDLDRAGLQEHAGVGELPPEPAGLQGGVMDTPVEPSSAYMGWSGVPATGLSPDLPYLNTHVDGGIRYYSTTSADASHFRSLLSGRVPAQSQQGADFTPCATSTAFCGASDGFASGETSTHAYATGTEECYNAAFGGSFYTYPN